MLPDSIIICCFKEINYSIAIYSHLYNYFTVIFNLRQYVIFK